MKRLFFSRRLTASLALVLAALTVEASHRPPSFKNPHVEIVAVAKTLGVPRRTTHSNGRRFEEFDIAIERFERVSGRDPGGDSALVIDTKRPVHVVHDLTCRGMWVDLLAGDVVEIKGEYVHPAGGGDLLHFTHAADGSCGRAGGHAGGYLRKKE